MAWLKGMNWDFGPFRSCILAGIGMTVQPWLRQRLRGTAAFLSGTGYSPLAIVNRQGLDCYIPALLDGIGRPDIPVYACPSVAGGAVRGNGDGVAALYGFCADTGGGAGVYRRWPARRYRRVSGYGAGGRIMSGVRVALVVGVASGAGVVSGDGVVSGAGAEVWGGLPASR